MNILNLLVNLLTAKDLVVEYWVSAWDSEGGDEELLVNSSLNSLAEVFAMYEQQNYHSGTFSHPDRYIRVFNWDGEEIYQHYGQSDDGNDQYIMSFTKEREYV